MAPSLYATKISDLAKPVSEKPVSEKPVKEKKPRSEKQIAAFEKAKEARKKTLETKKSFEKSVEPESPPETEKTVSEPEVVDEVMVEEEPKSKTKRTKKKCAEEVKLEKRQADEVIEPETSKAAKVEVSSQSEEEPPAWFKSYVIGVKEEQAKLANDKRPKKQVRIEAKEYAQKEWQKPQIRERVNNTNNSHMQKMYSMVFPNRRL
jgi:hypothetical protein